MFPLLRGESQRGNNEEKSKESNALSESFSAFHFPFLQEFDFSVKKVTRETSWESVTNLSSRNTKSEERETVRVLHSYSEVRSVAESGMKPKRECINAWGRNMTTQFCSRGKEERKMERERESKRWQVGRETLLMSMSESILGRHVCHMTRTQHTCFPSSR